MEETKDKNTYTFIFEGVKFHCELQSNLMVLIKTPIANVWLVPLEFLIEFNKKHQPDNLLKVSSSWIYSLSLTNDAQGFSKGHLLNDSFDYFQEGVFLKANPETKEYEYISPEECMTLCLVMGYL